MYNGRVEQHEAFRQWFRSVDRAEHVETVLEFGCGLAVGYADFFHDRVYTGTDLAPHLIDWCRKNRPNPRHAYRACDFVREAFPDPYDLVFSHGTIDNNYDMDEFLRAAVRASRRWVSSVPTAGSSRTWRTTGWNGGPPMGVTTTTCRRPGPEATLRAAGCREVAIFPSFTGRAAIPYETVIVARVAPGRGVTPGGPADVASSPPPRPPPVRPVRGPGQRVSGRPIHRHARPAPPGLPARGWSDGFPAYEALVAGLRDVPDLDVVHWLPWGRRRQAGKSVALRYDIDADPETAVRLARYNARYGLAGSFFVLHTAYYYGAWADGVWCRNAGMVRDWVRLVLAGAEVGLHLDPLGLYANPGVDGAAAVRTELAYLRSCRARWSEPSPTTACRCTGRKTSKSSAVARSGTAGR